MYLNETQETMAAEVTYDNVTSLDELFGMDSMSTAMTFEDTNGTIGEENSTVEEEILLEVV